MPINQSFNAYYIKFRGFSVIHNQSSKILDFAISVALFRKNINNTAKEINMAINPEVMAQRLQQRTGCAQHKAQHHTQRYLTICLDEVMHGVSCQKQTIGSVYINLTQLQNELGSILVHGKRYYLWQIFQSMPEKVFDIIKTTRPNKAVLRVELQELQSAIQPPRVIQPLPQPLDRHKAHKLKRLLGKIKKMS